MAMAAALLLLLSLSLGAHSVSGQDHGPVFKPIPPESGPSQNSIWAIIQDRRGFLWVATSEGLNRFDGYGFVTYRHDPHVPTSLPDNGIKSLFEDRHGNVWVGTNSGPARLDQRARRFDRIAVVGDGSNSDLATTVWQILEDSAGTVWLMTAAGVCRVDGACRVGRTYPRGGGDTQRLYRDRAGTLWLLDGLTNELYQYDPTDDRFVPAAVTGPPGWSSRFRLANFHEGRTGTIWLPGIDGIAALDLSRRRVDFVAQGPSSHVLWEDTEGALWVGRAGLHRYAPKTRSWSQFGLDFSGATALSQVRALYQDRSGTLWVGTLGGLYRWDPYLRQFSHRAHEPTNPASLSSSLVSALQEGSDGTLWVGTIGGGLNRLDRRTKRVTRFRHDPRDPQSLSNDVVWALHEDERGRLWMGTDDGLNLLDVRTGRFRVARCESPHRRHLANAVTSIAVDPQGAFWLGLYDGALARFDARAWRCQPVAAYGGPGIGAGGTVVDVDPSGSVWVGVEGYGLYRYEPVSGQSTGYRFGVGGVHGLSGHRLWAIHRGSDGFLWLGTDAGLIRFDAGSGTFTRFWDPGLPSSVVYAIVEDADARLWLSTNRGLVSFDPNAPAGRQFESFAAADGLRNIEFNRRAAVRSRTGEIFFGGLQGLTSFDPARILRRNPVAPPVVLTRVETRNRDGSKTLDPLGLDRLVLSYRDYSFSFEFVALSFTNPAKNQYTYMLEGFDPGWVGPSARRMAQYTNVPPGTYVFRVRGSNNDGVWNSEGASVRVTITPPFWQRWWFRASVLGAIAGVLVLAHRYRVRQVLAIERIRRQVATDLHDDVGSGLSQVAILSEVAKRDAAPAAAALMTETATLARAMRESMSDIVWAVDPRKDRLADLVQRMRQVAFNALEADGLRVDFRAPGEGEIERVGLPPDRRRHLLLVFKEATTNVVRHAQASHVWIDLALQGGALRLAIRDDGRGFDPRQGFDGHGLQSISRRAAELGARLTIESSPGRGTTLQVLLPLT